MPPRVTFWTGTWDPVREAISKEIASLRPLAAPPAPVISFSPGQRSDLFPREWTLRLSSRRWLTLRALGAVVERWGQVSHVFGGLRSWHHLRALGRRPILLTVAFCGVPEERSLLGKVSFFAAESQPIADELVRAGVPADRIEVVYPGVDLEEFRPALRPPQDRFRILFASSPADPGEFGARGIPLLVETARRCPEMDFVFLWRRWGDMAEGDRAFRALDPPPNVSRPHRGRARMAELYNTAHVIACCYSAGFGKSVPNSVIEGLACGRPALVTAGSGLAGLLRSRGAGIVAGGAPDALADGLRELRAEWDAYSEAARRLAEERFGSEHFQRAYTRMYGLLTAEKNSRSAFSRTFP